MAKLSRLAGSTSHVLQIFVQDSGKTDGSGLTGLAFNSSGLTCYYKRNTGPASVAVTLASVTTLGTYVSGGFKEVDATNMPGAYEFHPPDAAYGAGAKSVVFLLKGAANMAPVPIEIELTAVDNQDAARYGMSSLPASGTLAVNPTINATQSFNNAGQTSPLPANTTQLAGQTVTAAAGVTFPASVGTSTYSGGAVSSVTAGVTVTTNNDKAGYSLSAGGLDAISVADPGAPSGHTTLGKMVVALWRRQYRKVTKSSTQIREYADDGTTVNATQAVTDDGAGNQTLGAAS